MTERIRKISFLTDKKEMKLIEEACLYGAGADTNLKKAVKENDKYIIEFSYEELDDLAGYLAHCANHEKSGRKQDRWDNLCEKFERLLKLSDGMNSPLKHKIMPKQPCGLRYYIFDVGIKNQKDQKAVRKIQIAETKSLYNFAMLITQAFGFNFDHAFGFYSDFKKYHDSESVYELFTDMGEPTFPRAKGVKNTKIKQAFKKIGEQMLFLFDYGDGWHFSVELKEIKPAEKWDSKPIILESVGEAPEQYPPCEDEFENDKQ